MIEKVAELTGITVKQVDLYEDQAFKKKLALKPTDQLKRGGFEQGKQIFLKNDAAIHKAASHAAKDEEMKVDKPIPKHSSAPDVPMEEEKKEEAPPPKKCSHGP